MYNFKHFNIDASHMSQLRREIYHSEGIGYIVFRNFIDTKIVRHLVDYWCKYAKPIKSHRLYAGRQSMYPGCPCYYSLSEDATIFFNPFWSNTCDIVSNEISIAICHMRSQIEGKAFTREVFPRVGARCVVPRVVITRSGKLEPHSDYGLDEPNPRDVDLARIQATLYLSKYGRDYSGSGFLFTQNNGEKIGMEKHNELNPGDLVFWKYSNIHEIESIQVYGEQIGCVRMLFPPEMMMMPPAKPFPHFNIKKTIPKPVKSFIRKYVQLLQK